MFSRKFSIFVILFCLFAQTVFSQTIAAEGTDESTAELEAQAIELLRETSAMAATLNSSQNRIAFTLKTADILWEYDEPEAERLYRLTMQETRRYVGQVNNELNQVEAMAGTNWANAQSARTVRSKMNTSFSMIAGLITSLSTHDPELAYQFLQEIKQTINNQELLRRGERSFKNLENTIAQKLAEQDVTKSLEIARTKLSEGFSYQISSLLSTIYRKDAEKGRSFAKEILAKIKSSDPDPSSIWFLASLLRQGSLNFENIKKSKSPNQPIFSEQDLKEIAQIISKQYLTSSTVRRGGSVSASNLKLIEKYAPNEAAQIRQRQQQQAAQRTSGNTAGRPPSRSASSFNSAMQQISKAKNEYQQEIRKSIEGLQAEGITPEQKREIIEQTRGKILAVNDKDFRFSNLVWLAMMSKNSGEIEHAQMLLDQAEGFINRQPQDKNDFGKNRSLANAYAGVQPEKSFEILEDMIYRLNDVIESYVKFTKYSSSQSVVDNGEILVNRYSRQFTNYFIFSPNIYKDLAEADLERMIGLADKFNRIELRVETRLQIAGGLLKANKQMENKMNGVPVMIREAITVNE